MIRPSTLGRHAWMSYLAIAAPAVAVCSVSGIIACISGWEDIGPVETPSVPDWQRNVSLMALVSWPFIWLASLLMAHRFDRPGYRLLPYAVNLLPAGWLFVAILWSSAAEARGLDWMSAYLGGLVLLLIIGLAAALFNDDTPGQEEPAIG